jgi:hypothetical protein
MARPKRDPEITRRDSIEPAQSPVTEARAMEQLVRHGHSIEDVRGLIEISERDRMLLRENFSPLKAEQIVTFREKVLDEFSRLSPEDSQMNKRQGRLKTIQAEVIREITPAQPEATTQETRVCSRCLMRPIHGLGDLCKSCRRQKHQQGG